MVAIVGRPNVGKSTLFNRLAGERRALVHEKPGMTRDRRIERVEWDSRAFVCVDTGGFDIGLDDPLLEDVAQQARVAIAEADVIIFLTAVGEQDHPAELEMIDILRRSKKPVVVAVNKADNEKLDVQAGDFYKFGFDTVYPISALHGRNVADLLDAVFARLEQMPEAGREYLAGGIHVAVVGRQNVGKSSLVNRLLGEERLIASDLPGTTRDSIDTTIKTPEGDVFTLIDTAGIRRRGKVERGIEKISVLSSMIAIRRADVAVLLIDGAAGLKAQDAHIASYCLDEGCACMLVVNKWDLVEKDSKTADQFTKTLQREWAFLRYAPVLYVSALSGQRTSRILEIAKHIYANAGRRIPTAELNERFAAWVRRKPIPMRRNRQGKIKYITQVGIHPPTFVLSVNDPLLIHFSYLRYLENQLRSEYDFEGTPIRMIMRIKSKKLRERE
jgi:GTP-binding protein